MKQLLFLLLFPCLALAQYQGNSGQKITLGEQTTADGLVWRGLANLDTVAATSKITRANKQDTSAYLLLDTVTNLLWHYKIGSNAWTQAGGSTLDTATMLLPYWRSGRFSGVLPVANGGTGENMSGLPNNYLIRKNSSGVFDTASIFETGGNVGIGTSVPGAKFHVSAGYGLLSNVYSWAVYNTSSNGFAAQFGAANDVQFANTGNNAIISATGSNAILFGTNNTERLRILSGGNVGIGTSAPGSLLDVVTNTSYNSVIRVRSTGTNTPIVSMGVDAVASPDGYVGTQNNVPFAIRTSDVNRIWITTGGNVGIGTTTPLSKLNVIGTVRINSAAAPDANYFLQLENNTSQKAKANSWDTYSDKRIKTDIQPILNAIDKVNLLNPVYYQKHDSYVENDFLNIDFDSSVKSLGFIAQEVYNIIPEAVNTGTTNELWAMDYTKLIPILTKAIQEQNLLIKALEQRILTLENK